MIVDFVFFRSFRIISQVAACLNFPVHVFKCPCQCQTRLEKSIKYSINQIQYEMNQSNTVQNESLKEGLCFGSYFRVVTYHFLQRIRNSKFFQRKSPACCAAKRVTYKLYTFPSNENSNGVSHPTRMSHGSHEPDADDSRREHARAGYQCLGCKQTWSSVTAWARPGPEAAVEIVIAECSPILLWPC